MKGTGLKLNTLILAASLAMSAAPGQGATVALFNWEASPAAGIETAVNDWIAKEFHTGSGTQSWRLESVALQAKPHTAGHASGFELGQFSDNGGVPGEPTGPVGRS
jgi:hypothetical protein